MQNLSLSKQNFEKLRTQNCIYVDKTDQLHNLLEGTGVYFMARPRRFGKSLLIDTLDCIFQGRKELFEDLAISKTDYQWPVHPVVRLDFTKIARETPENFRRSFSATLQKQAASYGVDLALDESLNLMGNQLFEQLHRKTGKRVVLLIDEYDKPILDHVDKPEIAEEMRGIMRSFYEAHKPNDAHLHFTFITGVGRFARASIFSGMNHMVDLTFHPAAATLVGYTQQEVEHYFAEYLDHLQERFGGRNALLEQLRGWYNGYQFAEDGARVYNPFSLMNFLDTGRLSNYWFISGTPQFLIKQIAKQHTWKSNYELAKEALMDETQVFVSNLSTISLTALLYQTGYLTIDDCVKTEDSFPGPDDIPVQTWVTRYKLKYPNFEVAASMPACIFASMSSLPYEDIPTLMFSVRMSLHKGDLKTLISLLKTLFAHLVYQIQPQDKEGYYQSMFVLICKLSGLQVSAETSTNNGRIDIVVNTKERIYVTEVKLDEPATSAIKQIKDREYFQRFLHQGKTVVLLGISFSSKERTIVEWLSAVVEEQI